MVTFGSDIFMNDLRITSIRYSLDPTVVLREMECLSFNTSLPLPEAPGTSPGALNHCRVRLYLSLIICKGFKEKKLFFVLPRMKGLNCQVRRCLRFRALQLLAKISVHQLSHT
jgi:hypothetical protein